MSQKQVATRVSLYLEINYRTNYARTELKAVFTNISLTGGFLELDASRFMIKDKFKLAFVVADRERQIPVEIVWKNQNGAGVKFLPKSNQDYQIIEDLLYFVEQRQIGQEVF